MTEYTEIPGPQIHRIHELASATTQILGKPIKSYEVLGEQDGLAHVQFSLKTGETLTLAYPIT